MDLSEAVFGSWSIQIEPTIVLFLAGLFYLRGWVKIRRLVPHRFDYWRPVSFLGALILIFLAIGSPIDTFANLLLSVHMVQHLLLMMVIPPLLLLGYPYLPILAGLPRTFTRNFVGPFLTWPPLKSFGKWLTSPRVCWISYVGATLIWHLPACYELTLRSDNWHLFEHICFLGTGVLFWWPVVQPWPSRPQWPRWTMIPYLLLADIQNTALSAFLSFYDRVLYPSYEKVPHLGGVTALTDQAIAGAIMWVPGSMAYLLPAGIIALQYLSPARTAAVRQQNATLQRTKFARKIRSPHTGPLDLTRIPVFGKIIGSRRFRRVVQILMFALAIAVVADGFLGPQIAPMNLAGVLPWIHWRGLTVLALLVFGNFFCYACPFTFARDLGRRLFPPQWNWPRPLRSKWIAVLLIALYLWAYEAFSLWNSPWLTAWIIIGYFGAALFIDGFFRGASFCKYVCPIGQFHFVQSLVSPFEVKFRNADVCGQCKTFDCIKGNRSQRGCELRLFQPKKSSNMDCTFCLDCLHACPHDNVGLIATTPGRDLWLDRARSSIGRFGGRLDLAALAMVLVFGAFANAAGMTTPVVDWLGRIQFEFGILPRWLILAVFFGITILVLPGLALGLLAMLSKSLLHLRQTAKELFATFVMSCVPLGAAMWLAHFVFHIFTGSHTPLPIFQRIASDLHRPIFGAPDWMIRSWAIPELLDFEILALDLGLLLSLYAAWKIAVRIRIESRSAFRLFLPWAIFLTLLFFTGIWIIFQPMDMRGTMMQ